MCPGGQKRANGGVLYAKFCLLQAYFCGLWRSSSGGPPRRAGASLPAPWRPPARRAPRPAAARNAAAPAMPSSLLSLPSSSLLSSSSIVLFYFIPTASINPGTAYPSESSEPIIRLNLLLSRRIKKFIINARIEQSIAEIIPRNSVFEAVIKNFWSKKFRL